MFLKERIKSVHIVIISLFVLIVVILVYLPKNVRHQKPIVNVSLIDTSLSINIHSYLQKDKDIETIIQNYHQGKLSIDSLIQLLNQKRLIQVSAYFEEIKNLSSSADTVWYNVGKSYYNALGFISDVSEAEQIIASAARCFNKAIALNDKNINAKIMLASCYVQSNNPMLGVKMLKDIEKIDSNNVLLQMQLAEFSWRSNQLDKAIERYQKAIRLDSTKTEIYAYLSELYMQKKDTLQSIQFIRKFAAHLSDTTLKTNIENYIKTLNPNNH